MEKQYFTDPYLRSLKPKAQRYIAWDAAEPGFGLRVSPSGVKTFILTRRPLGMANTTTATLMRFNGSNLKAAKKEAEKVDAMLKRGENPAEIKRQASRETFEAMALDYIEAELKGKRQGKQVEDYLRKEWLGLVPTTVREQVSKMPARWTWTTTWSDGPNAYLRNRPAKFVTKTEITARLDVIAREPKHRKGRGKKGAKKDVRGPWAARHALDAVRRVFAWASAGHRYGVQVSPAAGLTNETVGLKGGVLKRRRALDDAEIRKVWEKAGELGVFGIGVKLLMLTAARRDDVFAAKWSEVKDLDGDRPRIAVPPERYKTDIEEPFEIELGPKAVELIKSLPRYKTCEFVFTNDGHRMLSSFSKPKAKVDELSNVTGWVLHDLRRTARGRIRKLGVSHHVCEQVLGHVLPGMAGTYDVDDWSSEKRDALLKWEAALLAIVEPPDPAKEDGKIMALRQAA